MPESKFTLDGYGYDGRIEEIREKYYRSLQNEQQIYLDHAGTTLYPSSLIQKFSENLISNVYGNPHSKSPSSQLTERWIEKARSQALSMFNADVRKYSLIFTSNATSAVKLIGEGMVTFPNCHYTYLKDSHTSLVGLRNLAGSFAVTDDIEKHIASNMTTDDQDIELISWPAQSNFSGKRYPSDDWIKRVDGMNSESKHHIYTLIDAAAISSTKPIDLSLVSPDFVVVSFYKIFGFPDLGALIVKNETLPKFFSNRNYFGGGTLDSLASESEFVARKSLTSFQSLEDGTLPFHSIIALSIAVEEYKRIYGSFENISRHTSALAFYFYQRLNQLKYKNGQKLVQIYGPSLNLYDNVQKQGPIISFNLKDPTGNWVGYSDFETIASSQNINIRAGTLCNTGSASSWIGLSDDEIISNYANGHVCGDTNDIMNGKPTGVIRVSLGASSNLSDVDGLINCLNDFYIKPFNNALYKISLTKTATNIPPFAHITSLTIYPIKSCSGYNISTPWVVNQGGLKWDREFCLINLSNYSVLSLKKYPQMVHIHPSIINSTTTPSMMIKHNDKKLIIPLSSPSSSSSDTILKVCGNNILAEIYNSPKIIEFFSSALNIDCTLARIQSEDYRMFKQPDPSTTATTTPTTMVNSSPILLISQSSVSKLSSDSLSTTTSPSHTPIDKQIFRANITISGNPPFSEDQWSAITISNSTFKLLGPCQRCNMICVDSTTGKTNNAPYKALHLTRKVNVSTSHITPSLTLTFIRERYTSVSI